MLYQVSVDGVGVSDVSSMLVLMVSVSVLLMALVLVSVILIALVLVSVVLIALVSVVCTQMPWRDLSPSTAANTIKCALVVAKTVLSMEGKN